jgi:hypothetical protein
LEALAHGHAEADSTASISAVPGSTARGTAGGSTGRDAAAGSVARDGAPGSTSPAPKVRSA